MHDDETGEVETRLERLETTLEAFIFHTNASFRRLHGEFREFKNEMKDFKNEMKGFKDEMKTFKDVTEKSNDSLRSILQDMKDEAAADRRETNRKWGDLANKMGTLVEDIVAPAVRPVVEKHFGILVTDLIPNMRRHRRDLGLKGEFDVIAVSDNHVFLVETKSAPKPEHAALFAAKLPFFRRLFPEYDGKTLIPIFASLRLDPETIDALTTHGIYALAYREWDYMDLLNADRLAVRGVGESTPTP